MKCLIVAVLTGSIGMILAFVGFLAGAASGDGCPLLWLASRPGAMLCSGDLFTFMVASLVFWGTAGTLTFGTAAAINYIRRGRTKV